MYVEWRYNYVYKLVMSLDLCGGHTLTTSLAVQFPKHSYLEKDVEQQLLYVQPSLSSYLQSIMKCQSWVIAYSCDGQQLMYCVMLTHGALLFWYG